MKSKRTLLVRILALAVVFGIAVWMCVIGRGHTIYLDNKDLAANGQEYTSRYQIQVFVNDESVGKIKSGERGMVTTMGQDFQMVLHITPEKDAKKVGSAVSLKIPYNMDGIIINLPALLDGAGEDVYLEEFIPDPVAEDEEDEEIVTDEFAMPSDEE